MILLFGMPRSGTSWLGKIFDSHPGTLYRHEPDKAYVHPEVPPFLPLSELEARREAIEAFLDGVLSIRTIDVVGKLPIFPKSYHSPLQHRMQKAAILMTKGWSRAFGEVRVPELVSPRHRSSVRIVWKSIVSLGRLGALVRVRDEARAILLVRHPCGQIASQLRGEAGGEFETRTPASEYYRVLAMLVDTEQGRAHGLTLELLRHMHPIERLTWMWVLINEKAMADIAGLESCTVARYEDLCAEPAEISRQLFSFAGLDWHPQTERFIQWSTGSEDDGYYSLVKDPRKSLSRWRQELSPDDVSRIQAIASRSPVGRLFIDETGPEQAAASG
jgi:hypothetical protein